MPVRQATWLKNLHFPSTRRQRITLSSLITQLQIMKLLRMSSSQSYQRAPHCLSRPTSHPLAKDQILTGTIAHGTTATERHLPALGRSGMHQSPFHYLKYLTFQATRIFQTVFDRLVDALKISHASSRRSWKHDALTSSRMAGVRV